MDSQIDTAQGSNVEQSANQSEDSAIAVPEEEKPDEKEKKLEVVPADQLETWDSKIAYFLTLVGYAVGFGNIWRFPYLVNENGGLAFLVPYFIMLAFEGIPLFFLELAIGQRMRKGPVGSWNSISKYLGGVGLASGCVCLVVGLYYNTLIAWVFSYFFRSFSDPLPWKNCSLATSFANNLTGTVELANKTHVSRKEFEMLVCEEKSATSYFWYHRTLDISTGITDNGTWNWPVFGYLILSWITIGLIIIKGIKSAGKVVYFTAVFPYVVLLIFFIGSFFLDGWEKGYTILWNPDWSKLADGEVWMKAGTQIFFSLGLAFGCLISFASYLPANNDCYRDAISVSCINCFTSVFAACVIFQIMGFKGTQKYKECYKHRQEEVWSHLDFTNTLGAFDSYFNKSAKSNHSFCIAPIANITWYALNNKNHTLLSSFSPKSQCNITEEVRKGGGGTGLVFIAFTEAVAQFPDPQWIWSILFFFMLLTLGIDSSFGTIEGAISSITDTKLFVKFKRWQITVGVCSILCLFSFIFATGWGVYVQSFLDEYSANWTMLILAFFECIAIAWVYGLAQFSYDIKLMTGKKPNVFMLICWKYISPALLFILLIASMVSQFSASKKMTNGTYNWTEKTGFQYTVHYANGTEADEDTPPGIIFIGYVILFFVILWIPVVALAAKFGKPILKEEIPHYFPEDELREERNIPDDANLENVTKLEGLLMGRSADDLADLAASRSQGNVAISDAIDGDGEIPGNQSDIPRGASQTDTTV